MPDTGGEARPGGRVTGRILRRPKAAMGPKAAPPEPSRAERLDRIIRVAVPEAIKEGVVAYDGDQEVLGERWAPESEDPADWAHFPKDMDSPGAPYEIHTLPAGYRLDINKADGSLLSAVGATVDACITTIEGLLELEPMKPAIAEEKSE